MGTIRTIMVGAAGALFSFLAPPRCRACGAALLDHTHPFLCRDCLAGMVWIGEGACRGCGYPAGPYATHGDQCMRCKGGKLHLTAAAAVARYWGGARSLVLSFKFAGETELAECLGDLLAERLRRADFGGIDFVLPVVLHSSRKRMRGYDQAALLAGRVAKKAGLVSRPDLLVRTRHTTPQATLGRADRLINMDGAFRAGGELSGKSVLLVDDVMTTGATMAACAKACRAAGARRVYALVFAR